MRWTYCGRCCTGIRARGPAAVVVSPCRVRAARPGVLRYILSMSDETSFARIEELVAEEHELRNRSGKTEEDLERLKNVEVQLDRCWDLLRQRRALRDAGKDPAEAALRPGDEVEGYLS